MTVMFTIVLVGLALVAGFISGHVHRALATPNYLEDIVAFHEKFELGYVGPPRVLPEALANFRIHFMEEELREYREAELQLGEVLRDQPLNVQLIDELLEKELDALIDLTYVVLGTAYLQFGQAAFNEGWHRVHEANMKKVRKLKAGSGHTDSGRAATYDVVKPAGWRPPNHLDLIRRRHFEPRIID